MRYRRSLFPGYSDTVEYNVLCPSGGPSVPASQDTGNVREFSVPCGQRPERCTLTAILHYRKIDQFLLNYVMGEKSGLTAPVVDIASATAPVWWRRRERETSMPVTAPPNSSPAASRRHRRIAWTASSLRALVLIGALVTWRIHKENAPEEYTPGETSADVTSALSDQAARSSRRPRPSRHEPK